MQRSRRDGSDPPKPRGRILFTGMGLLLLSVASGAGAQSFTIDDSPAAPAVGGVGFGGGLKTKEWLD